VPSRAETSRVFCRVGTTLPVEATLPRQSARLPPDPSLVVCCDRRARSAMRSIGRAHTSVPAHGDPCPLRTTALPWQSAYPRLHPGSPRNKYSHCRALVIRVRPLPSPRGSALTISQSFDGKEPLAGRASHRLTLCLGTRSVGINREPFIPRKRSVPLVDSPDERISHAAVRSPSPALDRSQSNTRTMGLPPKSVRFLPKASGLRAATVCLPAGLHLTTLARRFYHKNSIGKPLWRSLERPRVP
jgi:hypothetical protein